ncbi:MAG: virulence-associated family protein [Chlorobi bacterium]|nr:virulence-associated family protein [Chlorobiota bacterium]
MEETTVSVETIANDFATSMKGKLDQGLIDSSVASLKSITQSYPATGSVASLIFYLKFQVSVKGGKTFDGNAGGISSPGGGALFGDVYTDDINRLYNNTVSFEFQGTPVYLSILFFDKNSNLLGHFQAGAVSTVLGVGGGSGKWS